MNVAVAFPRLAISPYARRLARERAVELGGMAGSGPRGRIVAADVLAWRAPVAEVLPEPPVRPLPKPAIVFSASVSLTNLYRLAADAARVGLQIAVEDIAARAARGAMAGGPVDGTLGIEAGGRQIISGATPGMSIGAERRLRLAAQDDGADMSGEPAEATLLVLHSARVVPAALPLLPGRRLRFALVVDAVAERGHAVLGVDGDAVTETQAVTTLERFAEALEQPLALLA